MLYNFSEAAMGDGEEGISKIAAKGHYKRRGEIVDNPPNRIHIGKWV